MNGDDFRKEINGYRKVITKDGKVKYNIGDKKKFYNVA